MKASQVVRVTLSELGSADVSCRDVAEARQLLRMRVRRAHDAIIGPWSPVKRGDVYYGRAGAREARKLAPRHDSRRPLRWLYCRRV